LTLLAPLLARFPRCQQLVALEATSHYSLRGWSRYFLSLHAILFLLLTYNIHAATCRI
jgi:hypothetical protein